MPNSSPPGSSADRRAHRPLPLDHLRPALLRGDDQLRRPQVIGILKVDLQKEFGWTEIDYADIVFAFQFAYAVGFLFAGRMIDWLGTKKGYTVALVIWSLAAMAHAEVGLFGPAAAAILSLVGPDLYRVGCRIHLRPAGARVRRSGKLSRRDQSRRGVVPEEGTRARHRASSTRAPTSAPS